VWDKVYISKIDLNITVHNMCKEMQHFFFADQKVAHINKSGEAYNLELEANQAFSYLVHILGGIPLFIADVLLT
jgi:hypothetical protein